MRIMHPRHDPRRRWFVELKSSADGGRCPSRNATAHLPVRHLPENHQGHPPRCGAGCQMNRGRMKFKSSSQHLHPTDTEQMSEDVGYDFGLNRRCFVQLLSTGLMIAVNVTPALAQRRGDRGGRGIKLGARIHLAKDGTITVMTGKVEGGQGARAELTQAAAEELGLAPSQVQLVMADTD